VGVPFATLAPWRDERARGADVYVERLALADFRNYAHADIPLRPGVTCFTGANGQGKTNLVEAVAYLATLSSHRVATDAPLVRAGTSQAVIRAMVASGVDDPRHLLLELEINAGRANRARVNRVAQRNPRELLGGLRVVVFAPDDLAIVQGDPAERRAFLDALVVARWPRFAGVQADYALALRQRNALLKSLAGRGRSDIEALTSLDVWSEQLASFGAELVRARLDTLSLLLPHASEAYAAIAPANNRIAATYETRLDLAGVDGDETGIRERLLAAMAARRDDELRRGVSLVGPHRDDVTLGIGDLPARGYASHGESWSYALALRLGAFALLRDEGSVPVLILDDVFAELDATRRARLAESVGAAEQVLVTAAVPEDVPAQLRGARFEVVAGQVHPSGETAWTDPTIEAATRHYGDAGDVAGVKGADDG